MDFGTAKAMLDLNRHYLDNVFYAQDLGGGKTSVYLALLDVKEIARLGVKELSDKFSKFKPHLGAQANKDPSARQSDYKKCTIKEAERGWTEQFVASETVCYHEWR